MPQSHQKSLPSRHAFVLYHNLTLANNSFINQVIPCSPALPFYYASVSMAIAPYDYP